jgi:hypothetical protein
MTTATLGPEREHLYRASPREPEIIRVPEIGFVMIDGHGDPNTSAEYADAIQALYSLSYTLKFALRKELGLLYRVAPLEGLWWADNIAEFSQERKGDWSWTMMIAQPEDVTPERFEGARGDAGRKKDLPALPKTRLERFEEGAGRPNPLHRTVQRRGADHRSPTCLHPGARVLVRGQSPEAPRDLPERSAAQRPGEMEDDHPSAVHGGMSRS